MQAEPAEFREPRLRLGCLWSIEFELSLVGVLVQRFRRLVDGRHDRFKAGVIGQIIAGRILWLLVDRQLGESNVVAGVCAGRYQTQCAYRRFSGRWMRSLSNRKCAESSARVQCQHDKNRAAQQLGHLPQCARRRDRFDKIKRRGRDYSERPVRSQRGLGKLRGRRYVILRVACPRSR